MAVVLSTLGIFGVSAFAASDTGWTVDPNTSGLTVSDNSIGQVLTDKSVSSNSDGTATVSLSAISSTSNKTTTSSQPLDIVLVLDTSGSMSDKMGSGQNRITKLQALKNAVNGFIDAMNDVNKSISDTNQQHRISLVTFASSANMESDFTSNANSLKNSVNNLKASGATAADYALQTAKNVIDGTGRYTGARVGAQTVVIFFTDGEPNHYSGWDTDVANDAIEAAKDLKDDGTLVYSIGVYSGANPDARINTSTERNINAYLHSVSSNYPDASGWGSSYPWESDEWKMGERAANSDYYKAATDSDELNSIFEDIFEEVTSELAQPITGNLVFTDKLGEYAEVSGAPTITIGEQEYNATLSEGGTYTFSVPANYVEQQNSGNNNATTTVTVEIEDGTVTATIPAKALPLDVFNVSGSTTSQTYKANPIKINFSVKVSNGVLSGGYVDLTQISENYSGINKNAGTVTFYTNSWSDKDNGDTTATFTPATGNSYYGDSYREGSTSKSENKTGTADNVSSEKKDKSGVVTVALGNNGKITIDSLKPATIGGATGKDGIEATKVLDGRDWREGDEFTFTLTAKDGAPMPEGAVDGSVSKTVSYGDGSKTVDFGAITYEKAGSYTYTITEVIPADGDKLGGVTYDETAYTVTVKVEDNGDGTLKASVSYAAGDKSADSATFTNKYDVKPGATVDFATVKFGLTKTLTGVDWGDRTFTFSITPSGETPIPVDADGNEITKVTVSAPTNGNTTSVDFGTFVYDEAGTYIYTIKEIEPENTNGITYDTHEVTVTVTVSDNLQGGYVASCTTDGKLDFKNTYEATLDYNVEGGLNIQKTVEGTLAEGTYKFNVTAKDKASIEKLGSDSKSYEITANADNAGIASVFENLVFTQADDGNTYTYTITEQSSPASGWTYDDTTYTVTITVTDNGDGTLSARTIVSDGDGYSASYTYTSGSKDDVAVVPFTNTYNAEGTLGGDGSGSVKINATKTLVNGELSGNDFTFTVTDTNNDTVTTGTNSADGTITFNEVKYTSSKLVQDATNDIAKYDADSNTYSYQYTVAEDTSNLPAGVSGNVTSFTITVQVKDNGDGTLAISVVYPDDSNGSLSFQNTYATVENGTAQLTPSGTKVLDYEEGLTPDSIEGKFTFKLEAVTEGAPMPEKTTATNDAAGNVTFGEITYSIENVWGTDTEEDESGTETLIATRTKEFKYKVTETGSADGVTNDTEAKYFTVTVTDNGDGTVSISIDPETGVLFTFTNTYSVTPVESSPTGEGGITVAKSLSGRDMTEGEFTFALVGQTGTNSAGMELTASNAADGTVSFGSQTFSKPGTYAFDLYEVTGNAGGVSYDSMHHTVTATVTDNGDGTLSVVWSVEGSDDNAVTFQNTYTASATSVTLGGAKVLDGRELEEGEFSFVLKDADGNELQTVSNAADGSFVFQPVSYDETGTYEYTISEVAGDDATITYDETVYTVSVAVVDNGEGQLVIDGLTYNDEAQLPVFTNVYTAPAVADEGTDVLPKTGDTTSNVLPAVLVCAGVVIAGGAVVLRKRMMK